MNISDVLWLCGLGFLLLALACQALSLMLR